MEEKIMVRCPVCGHNHSVSGEFREKHYQWFVQCPSCPRWSKGLEWFAGSVGTLIGVAAGWELITNRIPTGTALSLTGLTLDVLGAFMLATGFMDRIIASVGTWGSYDVVAEWAPKQTRRLRIGLLALVLGFLLQAAGAFISV